MLGRVRGQRRDAVAVPEAPRGERRGERVRARVELARTSARGRGTSIATRSGVVRARSSSQRPIVCVPLIARNSSTSVDELAPAAPRRGGARALEQLDARVGDPRREKVARCAESTTTSSVPWRTSVGCAMLAEPVARVERRARRRLGRPADRILRRRERCARIRSTSSGAAHLGASAFSTKRRSATAGSSVGASAMSATVTLGIGTAIGPPGVVQPRTSLSTRSGPRERELLRDHPAEARPDDVRALDAGLVEHVQQRRRPSRATVYGPGGASLSPMPRLSKRITSKRSASPAATGSQPQRA